MKTVNIKGKEYVMVHERIKYFNEKYPNGSIITERSREEKLEIVKATVIPDVANPERKFTGYSQAMRGSSMINKTSATENAETSAVGRALGMMGIGIDAGMASANEVSKAKSTVIDQQDLDVLFSSN